MHVSVDEARDKDAASEIAAFLVGIPADQDIGLVYFSDSLTPHQDSAVEEDFTGRIHRDKSGVGVEHSGRILTTKFNRVLCIERQRASFWTKYFHLVAAISELDSGADGNRAWAERPEAARGEIGAIKRRLLTSYSYANPARAFTIKTKGPSGLGLMGGEGRGALCD